MFSGGGVAAARPSRAGVRRARTAPPGEVVRRARAAPPDELVRRARAAPPDEVVRLDARLARLVRGESRTRLVLGELLELLAQQGGHHELGFSSLGAYARERCGRSARWANESRLLAARVGKLPQLRALVVRHVLESLAAPHRAQREVRPHLRPRPLHVLEPRVRAPRCDAPPRAVPLAGRQRRRRQCHRPVHLVPPRGRTRRARGSDGNGGQPGVGAGAAVSPPHRNKLVYPRAP